MTNFANCVLKITSNIINLDENGSPDGALEKDEFTASGLIKTENGAVILSYKEKREGALISCSVTAKGEAVEVSRRGDVVCDMIFSVGKTHKTIYKSPPFSFDMEINTLKLENNIKNGSGSLSLFYTMTIGGAQKRCRMKISLI
ncbi:MAG: DUF1934 domain-containing protein [Clostridia bacterium]|nr:DUF1934 domain-containing protein [Clostridia bacterium]